jgi:hypothetical protein
MDQRAGLTFALRWGVPEADGLVGGDRSAELDPSYACWRSRVRSSHCVVERAVALTTDEVGNRLEICRAHVDDEDLAAFEAFATEAEQRYAAAAKAVAT